MKEVIKTMEAYCKIEARVTPWKRIGNGKWICVSSNCSGASGQYKIPPKPPIIKKINYLRLEHLK